MAAILCADGPPRAPATSNVRGYGSPQMKISAVLLIALICGIGLLLSACGGSSDESALRTPHAEVVLTAEEKQVWAPLPPDRSSVPVLLYHAIGSES